MKKLLYIFAALLLFSACETDEPGVNYDGPDDQGNLVIINNSTEDLALYRGADLIKVMSNSSEDYLVEIPNPEKATLDLRIYKLKDVEGDLNNPPADKIFKRWNITLSSENDPEKRSTWFITADDTEINSGTLMFSYVGSTDNQVDVFLSSKTGAKIITLKPGDQYQKALGIDYGNYTIFYRYWYSDPNTADGAVEVGWIEKEMVAGEEVDIWAVINEFRPEKFIQVPIWGSGEVIEDTHGKIKVTNDKGYPIQIWAGDQLIEQIMYLDDGSKQNASTIPALSFETYTIPAGNYTFVAKDLSAVQRGTVTGEIVKGKEYTWTVSSTELVETPSTSK